MGGANHSCDRHPESEPGNEYQRVNGTPAGNSDEFAANGVSVLKTRLHDREAFRALFSFGGTLAGLDPANVRNVPAAIENAQAFAQEVVAVLRANKGSAAA